MTSVGKDLDGSGRGLIEVIFQNFLEGLKKPRGISSG
jgi:hypothetical protein